MKRYALLLLGGLFWASGAAPTIAAERPIQPSGIEAREAALGELARLSQTGSKTFQIQASAFQGAELAPPFYYYSIDSTFLAYEEADPKEILRYVARRSVFFPIDGNTRLIGAIKVRLNESGQLVAYFLPIDSDLVARIEQFSRDTNLTEGQRLSVLSTGIAGDFFIVEDGLQVFSMAPASKQTLAMLGREKEDLHTVAFVPLDDFAPEIKRKLAESKRPTLEEDVGDEPIEDLE